MKEINEKKKILPTGGWYIVSLKHVNNNFNNSVRAASWVAYLGGEWAKPTPASQIYSQLSIACKSSALSLKKNQNLNYKYVFKLIVCN